MGGGRQVRKRGGVSDDVIEKNKNNKKLKK